MVDVIFASYFTKNINFHQHDSSNNGKGGSLPDDFNQIKSWYQSIQKLNLNAVIFHNELTQDFIQKYSTKQISFSYWESKNRLSYNDERFYCYLNYLKEHKDIERVFCTDLYDVIFYNNPFLLMTDKKDYSLFVGSESPSKSSAQWMIRKCKEMNYKTSRNNFSSSPLYNAGIIGGNRKIIIGLFESMTEEMKSVSQQFNSNMPVFNYCVEKLNDVKIFTGYPLHNVFKSNRVTDGVYIKHK